ncbi:MAG: hypothetical protein M1368_12800 [Thaumarchaeota archaeon]|nr:hypothetical protein [Nitrososphaerota archaeon]
MIFACGDEKEESLQIDVKKDESFMQKLEGEVVNVQEDMSGLGGPLTYTEVEDLQNIPPDSGNIFISITSIISITGHKGLAGPPTLKVSWKDGSSVRSTEFQEVLTGPSRKKDLSAWSEVIEQLRSDSLAISKIPAPPSKDILDGKVAYIMNDMQDKGVVEIEEQVEDQFKVDLEPDDVEAACDRLVSIGFLDKIADESGDDFYRKRSPVGIDDLSS